MGERKHDKLLGIRTVGLREWKDGHAQYNRYEPTPYKALDALAENYKFRGINRVVDFGSGRVESHLYPSFSAPVTGIEANCQTYEEALENKAAYRLSTAYCCTD